jgi:hypothetical protein
MAKDKVANILADLSDAEGSPGLIFYRTAYCSEAGSEIVQWMPSASMTKVVCASN